MPFEPRLGLSPLAYPQSMLLWAGVIGAMYVMYGSLFAMAAARR